MTAGVASLGVLAASSSTTSAIAVVVVVGVGVLWLASQLRIPAIILLLGAGVLLGPVLDVLDPAEQFGDLLFPVVSLGVGVLLFEGGLSLRWDRLQGRSVVLRLVTIGVVITWLIGWATVVVLFDVSRGLAAVIGAILTVSGPTVVIPLLRFARPRDPVGPILRWEGIVIDPIGATLAIVVLDAVVEDRGTTESIVRIATTLGVGLVAGLAVAAVVVLALHQHWIPDRLENPVTLMAAIGAFALADLLRPEAGLMATTVLGLALANQHWVPARHISEFEEDLGQLILGSLFILLGAGLDLDAVADVLAPSLGLVAVLVLVARPLAVAASTIGAGLSLRERVVLAWLAPRGIVAAAVASVFSLEYTEQTGQEIPELVPIVFTVVVATVLVYGFTIGPACRWLRVDRAPAEGIALVASEPWVVDLAAALAGNEVPVLLVTDEDVVASKARRAGLLVFNGRISSEELELAAEGVGIRDVVALSHHAEFNALTTGRFGEFLGRKHVYALDDRPRDRDSPGIRAPAQGRPPFGTSVHRDDVEAMLDAGGAVEVVDDLANVDGAAVLPLAVLGQPGKARLATAGGNELKPETTIVAMVARNTATPEPAPAP